VLLFPVSAGEGRAVRLHVRRSGGPSSAELQAIGIDVTEALDAIAGSTSHETARSLMELIRAALEDPLARGE
jgi:hypothetical protein